MPDPTHYKSFLVNEFGVSTEAFIHNSRSRVNVRLEEDAAWLLQRTSGDISHRSRGGAKDLTAGLG